MLIEEKIFNISSVPNRVQEREFICKFSARAKKCAARCSARLKANTTLHNVHRKKFLSANFLPVPNKTREIIRQL